MSEHMFIKGEVDYYHLPLDELGGLTWCQFCKKTMKVAEIGLHNGIANDWIEMRCPKCKKSVWVAELCDMKVLKLDKKCNECGKKTGDHNCYSMSYSMNKGSKVQYHCSKKCNDKHTKEISEKWKKSQKSKK